eukprot:4436040-Prymnesium_polylepis.1
MDPEQVLAARSRRGRPHERLVASARAALGPGDGAELRSNGGAGIVKSESGGGCPAARTGNAPAVSVPP